MDDLDQAFLFFLNQYLCFFRQLAYSVNGKAIEADALVGRTPLLYGTPRATNFLAYLRYGMAR